MNQFTDLRTAIVLEKLATYAMVFGMMLTGLAVFNIVIANSTSTLTQTINAGTLSADIVDANYDTVASPAVAFGAAAFAYSVSTSTATLGSASQQILVSNGRGAGNGSWTLTLAPTGTAAHWYGGLSEYSYDSADHSTGTMLVNPSVGTLAGVSGCSTSGISKGSQSYFSPSLQSITLLTASSASVGCRWTLQGVALDEEIPGGTVAGSYQIGMVVTAT